MPRRPEAALTVLVAAGGLLLARCGEEPAKPLVDTTPPRLRITSPAAGATLGASPLLTAEASDDVGVATVAFTVHPADTSGTLDGDSLVATSGPIPDAPYAWLWNIDPTPNGRFGLLAVATDAAGNHAADTVVVQLDRDREPPAVTIATPVEGAILAGEVLIEVTVTDESLIDSVRVAVRDSLGAEVFGRTFLQPPYAAAWDATLVVPGGYDFCGAAWDALGHSSEPTCIRAQVKRPEQLTLYYDDGIVDIGYHLSASWQECVVFRNPFDVPVRVDEVEFFIHGQASLGAPFRFVIWNAPNGIPADEAQGTPVLAIREPRNRFGFFTGFQVVVPPNGTFAAGMQQLDTDLVIVGHDTTNPFRENTFFLTSPAGTTTWTTLETIGERLVPMIRVTIVTPAGARVTLAPAPGALPAGDYGVAPPVRGVEAAWTSAATFRTPPAR